MWSHHTYPVLPHSYIYKQSSAETTQVLLLDPRIVTEWVLSDRWGAEEGTPEAV